MSGTWNDGYVTDIGYTYGYYRELAPVFQRFCLLLRGFAPPEAVDANHCELGFGQGVSINIHAAANPGHFVGNDFNPSHTAHAVAMATASGADAQLVDHSFEELLEQDLPQFNSISLHGIWTWVSKANQSIITEFARRHLAPGGAFYVSYNCFPGWAAAYPLRQLFVLHDQFAAARESTKVRVQKALKFTEELLAANPLYGRQITDLQDRFKKIKEQNPSYLAHEYFNRDWNCMYFADMADLLSAAKLDYASSASPIDNVEAIHLSAEARAFLARIEQPIMREQARDYFTNQQFRKDLYIRGAVRLHPMEQRERLLATRFVLLVPPEDVPKKVQGVLGEATLVPELYGPVVTALAANNHEPKTMGDLMKVIPPQNAYTSIVQVMTMLAGLSVAAPCQPEKHAQLARKRCDALNRHLLDQARRTGQIAVLASPVTGMGVNVDRFNKMFLLAHLNKRSDAAEFVWTLLKNNDEALLDKEGKPMRDAEANVAELRNRHERFVRQILPILKAAGIA